MYNKTQTVKINNDIWKVKLVSPKKKKMIVDDDFIHLGLSEMKNLKISIRRCMEQTVTRSTLVHELCHAFIFSYGYKIDDEESMCDFIACKGDQIMAMADLIMEGWECNFY